MSLMSLMSLKSTIPISVPVGKLLDKHADGPRAPSDAVYDKAKGGLQSKAYAAGKCQSLESEKGISVALSTLHVTKEDLAPVRGGSAPASYSSSHFTSTPDLARDPLTSSGPQSGSASDGFLADTSAADVTADVIGGMAASGASVNSDWRMLSSGSFDEAYFECTNISSGGRMTPTSVPDAGTHFDETMMNTCESDGGSHELPGAMMTQFGSSWLPSPSACGMEGVVTSSNCFMLPASTSPTSLMTTPSTESMLETSDGFSPAASAPSLACGGPNFDDKQPCGVPSCPSGLPSPVHMETFVPFITYPSEPPELLFEDMDYCSSTAAQPSFDVYDQRYDQCYCQLQQDRPSHIYSVSASRAPTLPHGSLCFEVPGANAGPVTNLHDQISSYQFHPSVSAPAPSTHRLLQNQEQSNDHDARWSADVSPQFIATSPVKSTTTSTATAVQAQSCSVGGDPPGSVQCKCEFKTERSMPKRTLRSSTLSHRALSAVRQTSIDPSASLGTTKTSTTGSAPPTSLVNQSAEIRLLTSLNNCYWKNGRKNLQCFPSCPEHRDFYSMKMNNRKHSSVGVCRGPVHCHAFTGASNIEVARSTVHPLANMALEATVGSNMGRQMKYEHGVGASNSGGGAQELFVLGRFERVPQKDSTNLLEELREPPRFPSAAAFEEFRYSCFQAVEMEERRVLLPPPGSLKPSDVDSVGAGAREEGKQPTLATGKQRVMRSTWFFLPDVWKVQPMLKKKRKATRSTPAQTFPFCFRVFIYVRSASKGSASVSSKGDSDAEYACIADTASSFFELYSTRTVDRIKRKYWSGGSGDGSSGGSSGKAAASGAVKRQTHVFKRL